MMYTHGRVCSAMTFSMLLFIILFSATFSVSEAEEDFKAMKVKELKAFLRKRGADCLACSSKEDYVERATEIKDWPEIEEKEQAANLEGENLATLLNDGKLDDEERMKKLKEALEKAGVDTSSLFTKENVLKAEELAKAFKDQKDPEMFDATGASSEQSEEDVEKTEVNAEEVVTQAEQGGDADAEGKTEL